MLHSSATRRTSRFMLSACVATVRERTFAFWHDPLGEAEGG
jgi:hypothetical protein